MSRVKRLNTVVNIVRIFKNAVRDLVTATHGLN